MTKRSVNIEALLITISFCIVSCNSSNKQSSNHSNLLEQKKDSILMQNSRLPDFFINWNNISITKIDEIENIIELHQTALKNSTKRTSEFFDGYDGRKIIFVDQFYLLSGKTSFDYKEDNFIVLEHILNFDHFGTTLNLFIETKEGYICYEYQLYSGDGAWNSKATYYKRTIKNKLIQYADKVKLNGKLDDFYMLTIVTKGEINCYPILFLNKENQEELVRILLDSQNHN